MKRCGNFTIIGKYDSKWWLLQDDSGEEFLFDPEAKVLKYWNGNELHMKWISVKSSKPSADGEYLCFLRNPNAAMTLVRQCRFSTKFGFCPVEHDSLITHWMPLPKPPKGT